MPVALRVPPIPRPVAEPVRRAVAGQVFRLLEARPGRPGNPVERATEDPGDPGLFGPDSVTWRVHADLPAMLIGGFSALLLQTLHPGAMAGVADHSNYREDAAGRLHRTGAFVANTTYGSRRVAEEAIEIVRRVHRTVVGVRPDGVPYSANDPDLLTWVHVAEIGQFVRSYQRYGPWPLRPSEVDRYYAEVAEIARRLGADDVPTSAAEVLAYYRRVRPDLGAGEQAREAIRFICEPKGTNPGDRATYAMIVAAAVAVLPGWARPMLGLNQPRLVTVGVRPPVWLTSAALRWALGESPVVARARERVGR
jgi:uncharacterized protein (DUF2236 family)